MVSRLDVLAVALGRGDRELHLDLAALEGSRELEPGRLEDAEHGAVVGQHRRHEALDPDLGGTCGELLEQPRADAPPLTLVGHGESGLRQLRVAETDVAGDADHALAVRVDESTEQCPAFVPVGLDEALDEPGAERSEAVEAQVEASL